MLLQSFLAKLSLLLAVLAYSIAPAGGGVGNLRSSSVGAGERLPARIDLQIPFKTPSRWQSWQGSKKEMMPLAVNGQVKLFGVRRQKFLYAAGDSWFVYGIPGQTVLSQKRYGPKRSECAPPHDGLDFVAVPGQKVTAAAAGKVIFVGNYLGGTVMIDHGAGLVATYGYLSKIKVKAGYAVAQGQEIGRVADPRLGEGFAGHLHFGLDRILPPWLMGASAKESRITLDPLRFMDLKGAIIPRTEANTGVVRERVSLKPARSE